MTATPAARKKARHYAMQALYQWQMTGNALNVIEAQFHSDYDMSKVDTDYFSELLHQVPAQLSEVEAAFSHLLVDRELRELDPISLALLRLSTYELMKRIDVPYKVIINEAVNLAKKFGATDSYKFINGVLDKAVLELRAVEVQAERNRHL